MTQRPYLIDWSTDWLASGDTVEEYATHATLEDALAHVDALLRLHIDTRSRQTVAHVRLVGPAIVERTWEWVDESDSVLADRHLVETTEQRHVELACNFHPDPDCYACLGTGKVVGFRHTGARCQCLDWCWTHDSTKCGLPPVVSEGMIDEDPPWDEGGVTCSICDALGHGYPGGPPCPLEDRGYDTDGVQR